MLCGGRMIKKVKAKTRAFEQLQLVHKAIAEEHGSSIDNKPYVIDVWGRSPRAWLGIVPCLTRTFAQGGGFYFLPKARTFTLQEMCRLQGLPTSLVADAKRLDIQEDSTWATTRKAYPARWSPNDAPERPNGRGNLPSAFGRPNLGVVHMKVCLVG